MQATITLFNLTLGSSIKHVSTPSNVLSKSGLLINFKVSFMYIPTPPAFVLEALLINSYPGMDTLLKLPSVSLVSDTVIKLGDSLTVSRISFKRHRFFGKLRMLHLNIENPFDEVF